MSVVTIANRPPTMPRLAVRMPSAAAFPLPHDSRRIAGLLEDAVLLTLIAFLVPIAILVVGTPIALCIRGIVAIARLL